MNDIGRYLYSKVVSMSMNNHMSYYRITVDLEYPRKEYINNFFF